MLRFSILATTLVAHATLSVSAVAADIFTSPRLEAATSWIGNTYGGAKKWVQQDIHALAVTPDGTVFTNVPWDEGGGNAGEYRDGELIRYGMRTHGWGNNGGEAVAVNSKYVFLGARVSNEGGKLVDPQTWPPKDAMWLGVSRRLRADISQGAPFAGGKGGKGNTLKESFLVVAEVPDKTPGEIPGICATDERLYIADPATRQIQVYNVDSMAPIASWKVDRPGPLAVDHTGTVWMLERRTDAQLARLRRFTPGGEEAAPVFPFPPAIAPAAFCLAEDGRVLVADDGPAQQIRIYTPEGNDLRESGTFGELGGIASGEPGAFGDRKLNRVSALGCDAHDNVYVAHDAQSGGGGTVLESYRLADGILNWRLFGLTFVDMADLATGSDEAFTKEERFHLNFHESAGREAQYAGYTIDRNAYPQDPRLHIWSGGAWVRQIGGRTILFVNDMNGDQLQVYRFAPDTGAAIPSGLFAKRPIHLKGDDAWPPHQPAKGAWIWRDANGNGAFDPAEYQSAPGDAEAPAAQGWWVDRAGNVWLATEKDGLRFFPFEGIDARGNPQWNFSSMQTFPHPTGFREVKRLRYDMMSDTLYLGGTTETDRNQHWKPMGPVVACYEGWLLGERKQAWQFTLPYVRGASGHESCEPMGFDVAGEYLFVPYTGASKANGVATGRVEIFQVKDGASLGHIEPGPEVGEIGLQDLRETLTAHRRSDGEYVIFLEDDYKSKIVMYRFKGPTKN